MKNKTLEDKLIYLLNDYRILTSPFQKLGSRVLFQHIADEIATDVKSFLEELEEIPWPSNADEIPSDIGLISKKC